MLYLVILLRFEPKTYRLALIAEGKTSQAIAGELFLSPLTIDTHRKNLIQKFEVKNVAELIRAAHQQHIF